MPNLSGKFCRLSRSSAPNFMGGVGMLLDGVTTSVNLSEKFRVLDGKLFDVWILYLA